MRVAIMQPTYLSWIGYFGMIDRVDLFILLDTVQFAKRSWQQRNKIKTAHGPMWLTVPVLSKGKSRQIINEVEIDSSRNHAAAHIASLENNYRKAPHFQEYSHELFPLLDKGFHYLSEMNAELIERICEILGITTSIQYASRMNNSGNKADLLAMLCAQVGATEYVSALGSREYLEKSDAFQNEGIDIKYHDYEHPVYSQLFGDFEPYMSIVDLLFNLGPESLSTIRKGFVK